MAPNATKKWPPSPRRRIYLMRHGEVDYFGPDGRPYRPATVPLNKEGRRQAEAAGRELTVVPLDRVITSGLRRSLETAELATAGRGLTLEARAEFREIEPGRMLTAEMLQLLTQDQVRHAFLGAMDHEIGTDTRFLGGETFGELQERVLPDFEQVLADSTWQHLLLVAHGVVNRVLLARMLGMEIACIGRFEQDAGCLNVIDVGDDGRFLIRLLNHSPLNTLKHGVELTTMERLYQQFLQGRR